MGMGRLGDYRTSAQKAGRSAGQRQRRMATDRKIQNRAASVYPTSVRPTILKSSRYDTEDLALYGVCKQDSEWVLTVLAIQRDVEKLVSDHQGATRGEVKDRTVVKPTLGNNPNPKDGLEIGRFSTKKEALSEVSASSSTRIESGRYVVKLSDWSRSMNTHKVDRGKFKEFVDSLATVRVS